MNRWLTAGLLLLASAAIAGGQVRVKDIAQIQGNRSNQLIGYGLVVGLEGSGDSNSSTFTPQSVANALQRLGVTVTPGTLKMKNVAAVIVTTELPAFAKNGGRIDVVVSSLGDARSLQGGTLLQTTLQGADGEVYAVAQGPLTIGGFNFSAGGSQGQKNHVNVGRIPRGAIIEKEVPTSISDGRSVDITLKDPDFTTAGRIAEAINAAKIPDATAQALDTYTVRVSVPASMRGNVVAFCGQLERLTLVPDTAAKIVINERTGTIVIGGDVRVAPCAIAQGSIQVKVENTPVVAIPAPFSGNGKPVVVDQKAVKVKEEKAQLAAVPSTTTLDQLVKALNALGVTPRDLINILQTMRNGGYISGDIEVQ